MHWEETAQGRQFSENVDLSSINNEKSMEDPEPGMADFEDADRLWFIALSAALLAGVIGWAAGNLASRLFHWDGMSQGLPARGRGQHDPAILTILVEARQTAETKNAALAFGILGGVLGAAFVVAKGQPGSVRPKASLAHSRWNLCRDRGRRRSGPRTGPWAICRSR
jgi:hypothetical protein